MVPHTLDMILTVIVLSFWFAFPIGIFLSMSYVDKNTDQLIRLNDLRHDSAEPVVVTKKETVRKKPKTPNRRPTLLPH